MISIGLMLLRIIPMALQLFGFVEKADAWWEHIEQKKKEVAVAKAKNDVAKLLDGAAADELRRSWSRRENPKD